MIRLIGKAMIATFGPVGGLIAHFVLNQHALWGVAIGIFLSALINQVSNKGTASIAGVEDAGSDSGGDSGSDINNSIGG